MAFGQNGPMVSTSVAGSSESACDGLGDAADDEGSIDTAKLGHGCVRVILRDADRGGRFVVSRRRSVDGYREGTMAAWQDAYAACDCWKIHLVLYIIINYVVTFPVSASTIRSELTACVHYYVFLFVFK
jgi:hypothetical protein